MVQTRLARGLGSACIIATLAVACASTETGDIIDVGDAGASDAALTDVTVNRADVSVPKPPPPPPQDTGAPPVQVDTGTPPAGQCPSTCTYDSECQSTCPSAPTGGQNCCDVTTNTCFLSGSGDCTMGGGDPDGGADGGTD